jgi:hypothetical protein
MFAVSRTATVVYWSEFLATDPEARVRFPTLQDFLRSNGSGIEELFGRNSSDSGLEIREYGLGDPLRWH